MSQAEPPSLSDLALAVGRLRVHDVSPTITRDLPVFFMYPNPEIRPLYEHAAGGAAANVLEIAEHVGTHVDAPFHFDPAGPTVDALAPDVLLLKPFKKFDLSANDHQPGEPVEREHLVAAAEIQGLTLEPGDVAVLQMGWDRYLAGGAAEREPGWWGRNEPGLSEAACEYLAAARVSAVACDTAACDVSCRDGQMLSAPGHTKHFLPHGILIIEGLTGLANVPASGLLVALPLKIGGGTGSPLRVLLLTN